VLTHAASHPTPPLHCPHTRQQNTPQADGNEFFCHPVPFGDNLYAKERLRVAPPRRAHDEKPGATSSSGAGGSAAAANEKVWGGGRLGRGRGSACGYRGEGGVMLALLLLLPALLV
jgi:hypothetical protein